ncbi:MAG: inorganic phosphate transporter [Ignavibacteriaceae bacterium]|nr:inorganic phosphate transporter [Ignavibacteriaceae bacterium]
MFGDYSFGLILVLVLVLAAEFVNGWTDAPNAIATIVSTRVLSPTTAVLMAVFMNIAGAFAGTAVAATIGKGIVESSVINLVTIGAAMVSIVFWSTLAWRFGIPTSESHALVSGLAGAALATAGPDALLWAGWEKVLLGLVFSTFLGFFGAAIIMISVYWIFRKSSQTHVKKVFGRLQALSAAFMAFGHGSNDGQKFIGVFTLAMVLGGAIPEFKVSFEIIVLCSLIMGLGTSVGGWRIIKTMGMKMVKLETHQGFSAETGAAIVIQLASVFGIPLSTTHTINSAILGSGSVTRLSAVRWGVVRELVLAWVLTFPVCGFISWIVANIFQKLF